MQRTGDTPTARGIPGNSNPIFAVNAFGATGDGATMDTESIQQAVDRAAEAGGGTVYFPPGDYLAGTIRLRDNVTLYLEYGSTLWGSTDLAQYDAEHKHLLYARNAGNIAIAGRGAIDGNGPRFWDGGRLERWLRGECDLPRTSDMIRFDKCENITIEDIEVRYGAFWNIGFGHCHRIAVRALTIINGIYEEDGPNTDGINLWHCTRVRVSDCDIQTGDDCIVVLGDSRDVTITNCHLTSSETALMISGVRNLTVSNCTIHDSGSGIGFRVWNGITVDGVLIDNVAIDVSSRFNTGGQAIYLWSFPLYIESNDEIPKDEPLPPAGVVDNVTISNVTAKVNGGIFITGFREKEGYVKRLTLQNIEIVMLGRMKKSEELNADPPDPYPIYGHHGAPYAMYFRWIDDLKLRNLRFTWNTPEQADWGSALRCVDVGELEIAGFEGRQAIPSDAPAIRLINVGRAFVHGCRAPEHTGTFLSLEDGTGDLTLTGNELSRAQQAYAIDENSSPLIFEAANRNPE
ncbi:MAG: hypothetical protein HOC74_00390 [Gemmatimonadetes bacterium]|jgi:hypothetical protein|nr:hypothetical protein [Gemmatimonadota bacterium]